MDLILLIFKERELLIVMKIKALLACCCSAVIMVPVYAKKPESKDKEIQRSIQLMEERVSELMADRVKKDGILKDLDTINDATLEELMEREKLMFPAEEFYGSHWDNRFVNPFQGGVSVTYPDSAQIDCSSFVIPIDGQVRVTSKYGPRRRRMHRGIDLKVQIGDTIRAAFDGRIRIRSFERRGYGYYLVIRHPNGLETVYGHLSKFLVDENQIVRAGDAIALGGNTGRSTGSHLHFETRFLGIDLNPAELIDFENSVPHKDLYVFRNVKVNGRRTNMYTSSDTHFVFHRVKSGDTLGAISRKYGTTVSELCRLNGLKSTSVLRIGQSLRVNTTSGTIASTQQKEVKNTTATQAPATQTAAKASTGNPESSAVYHKIQSGDTLGAIAIKYGTTVSKLCELNGITPKTVLRLGRSLRTS